MLRKASIKDVKSIQKLLSHYADKGDMLSRSLSELYESLRDFYIIEADGELIGVAALHILWDDLAEIRSVAVAEGDRMKGVGREVVTACIDEGRKLGLKRLFCLTYKPEFFSKLGFRVVDKSELPHKVWSDCLKCVKFPDCDEIAMILDL
ncbi:MAG: N-acetyltransferase [Desulfuromonadales bacterium]|nr:N-acetyltransferase [Desulfuromonadales bacterium]